jgi:Putative rRNA methylase
MGLGVKAQVRLPVVYSQAKYVGAVTNAGHLRIARIQSTLRIIMIMTLWRRAHTSFLQPFAKKQFVQPHFSSQGPNSGQNEDVTVNSFFRSALSRAQQTLSVVNTATDEQTRAKDGAPSSFSTASRALSSDIAARKGPSSVIDEILPRPSNTSNLYGRNPTVTATALAHSLWSYILLPGVDTVIDATAGNGGDALVLAKLLFSAGDRSVSHSKLICVDVDPKACDATRQRLSGVFPDLMDHCIHVLPISHDPLPLSYVEASSVESIGLVAYNLGYLPHAAETIMTRTESTLNSLAQAATLLRVGGMISVMTYPGSNKKEDSVVRAFVTGLALLSSRTVDWSTHTYLETDSHWNQRILDQLHQVIQHYEYGGQQPVKWRVHEHTKLGWADAPTLFTATRIN